MVDQLKPQLRAINAATGGAFYDALEECRAVGATPGFSVEVVHDADAQATGAETTSERVCFRLEASRQDVTVAEWSWLIDAADWDGYRVAIELGVGSMVGSVRRRLTKLKREHDELWPADGMEPGEGAPLGSEPDGSESSGG